MNYGMITDASGFILSTYAGQEPIPEGYSAIAEELYFQIAPGSSYVDGKILPPTIVAPA